MFMPKVFSIISRFFKQSIINLVKKRGNLVQYIIKISMLQEIFPDEKKWFPDMKNSKKQQKYLNLFQKKFQSDLVKKNILILFVS